MDSLDFDLVVIRGGPAGLSGALAAATFGKKAAVIEKAPLVGGADINTGTIPSKALRESALVISRWRARKLLGVEISARRQAKLSEFTYHERQVAEGERIHLETRLRERRVQLFQGRASFLGSFPRPQVKNLYYSANNAFLASANSSSFSLVTFG